MKDALESQLRGMVCRGNLDLEEAQREIASNWIAAYRKYFQTDTPAGSREAHRLDDDLRPTGPALDPKFLEPPGQPTCTAITGTATWQKAMVDGLLVTRTVSCCGDTDPAGVWVCDPAARERESGTLWSPEGSLP